MNQKQKSKSRREFISDAAVIGMAGAIGTGHILSSCSSQREKYDAPVLLDVAPDGPSLKAGLIGCGGRGTGAAFNFLNAGPDLQITALGDVFQDRLDISRASLKEQRGVDIPDQNCFVGFDAYKYVMDTDVDIVILATPPHFRPLHLETAVQARKHAFVEKPCAVDAIGAKTVMASAKMADAAGLSIVSGLQIRHARDYNATLAMIRSGAIGSLITGNCLRLGGGGWRRIRPSGMSDMEWMLRDWQNWTWLSGDHIVEQFVHHIDTFNWFFGKYPTQAVALGGRHRRQTGDQYDYISIEYSFDDAAKYYGMHRQIPGCFNRSYNHMIYGTEGYTNSNNRIWDYDNNLIWEHEYPPDEDGQPSRSLQMGYTDQSHINLVTAIRTNTPVNEAEHNASSSLVAIMGRESAYTGQLITWDDMMNSNLRLGPTEYRWGTVDIKEEPPIPGTVS